MSGAAASHVSRSVPAGAAARPSRAGRRDRSRSRAPAGAAEGWESDWEEAALDARGALMAAPWLSALMMLSPDRIAFVKPFFELFITFSPSVPFRPGHRPRRRTHQEKPDGGRGWVQEVSRFAPPPRLKIIVTSRPLREARDRQLRQTVPGSRETGRVLHALPRHPVATDRENSEEKRRKAAENRAAQRTPPRGGLLELSE